MSPASADRGLLRRQQADEGLHRHGQHRHQFAALHGLRRSPATSAPSARTSCRASMRTSSLPISSSSSAPTPPGAIPCSISGMRRPSARTATKHRRDRSAPHRDRRDRRPASAARARQRRRAVQRPAAPISIAPGAVDTRLHRRATRPASPRRPRSPRPTPPRSDASPHDCGLPPRARLRRFYDLVRRDANGSSRSTRRASTNPRPAPTRSTPSSTAISPPGGSAGPAWGRSRSPASPTRWAGAKSAASPTSSPRIWTSTIRRPRRVAPLLARRRASRRDAGPEGGRSVRGGRGRPRQGGLDHRHQPRRQHAETPTGCARALGACPLVVVSDCMARTDTTALRRCAAARPPPGARRTARSPIPSGRISRQRRVPAGPGEAHARLVADVARSPAAWASRRPSPSTSPPGSTPNMPN